MARIPCINNKEELILALKMSLRIPTHVTCKWDVMPDLLGNPFWLSKWEKVAIVHDGISSMPKSDIDLYRNLIVECKAHSLHVCFVFNDRDYSIIDVR